MEILKIKFERNWNFESYLRIGDLQIKFKNWNFGIKFERNQNFENYLGLRIMKIKL